MKCIKVEAYRNIVIVSTKQKCLNHFILNDQAANHNNVMHVDRKYDIDEKRPKPQMGTYVVNNMFMFN